MNDVTEETAHKCKTARIFLSGAFYEYETQNLHAKLEDRWGFALDIGKGVLDMKGESARLAVHVGYSPDVAFGH